MGEGWACLEYGIRMTLGLGIERVGALAKLPILKNTWGLSWVFQYLPAFQTGFKLQPFGSMKNMKLATETLRPKTWLCWLVTGESNTSDRKWSSRRLSVTKSYYDYANPLPFLATILIRDKFCHIKLIYWDLHGRDHSRHLVQTSEKLA